MKVKVNGKITEIVSSLPLEELLKIVKVENPQLVSVQLNGKFVKKEELASTLVKENDEIDFLYFMGGG